MLCLVGVRSARTKRYEKTLYISYRDSSFRISISKRFRIKDLKYLVHFLWLKYSTPGRKMIVYSLNELLRFLEDLTVILKNVENKEKTGNAVRRYAQTGKFR